MSMSSTLSDTQTHPIFMYDVAYEYVKTKQKTDVFVVEYPVILFANLPVSHASTS